MSATITNLYKNLISQKSKKGQNNLIIIQCESKKVFLAALSATLLNGVFSIFKKIYNTSWYFNGPEKKSANLLFSQNQKFRKAKMCI